jgi:flagellar biosynthetic protein FliQ
MSPALAIDLVRHALMLALAVSGPLLLTVLVVGAVVGMLQAMTQIQEQTLVFVPKLVALALVGLLILPWTLRSLAGYIAETLRSLPLLTP